MESVNEDFVSSAIRLKPDLVLVEYELGGVIRDDIKRIYRLGTFESVNVFKEEVSPGRIDLIFVVTERPYIRSVLFEGNDKVNVKDLEEEISLSRGDRLSLAKINDDSEDIKELYYEKGFRFATVTSRIDEVEDGVAVTYVIDEGPKSLIRKVIIEGNEKISDWYITHKVMKTKIDRFYNTKTLDEKLLEDDLKLIENTYARLGYVRAEVTDHRAEFLDDRAKIDIYITISEGEKYENGEITFSGNEVYDNDALFDLVNWRSGKVYNADIENGSIEAIRTKYRNTGYLFSSVDGVRTIDDEELIVDLDVSIRENDPATVRRIDIYGNTSTKDKVIRREVRLLPGETYKEYKLIRTIQRLGNLGYFDDIQPDLRVADPETGRVDIILSVVEKSNITKFNFSAGYSSLDGLVGSLGLTWVNFDAGKLPIIWKCKGGGQELRFNTEFGRRRSQYNVGFTEPYLFDTPMMIGFDIYSQSNLRSYYDESKRGGAVYLGRPLSEYVSARLSYKFEQIEVSTSYDDLGRLPGWVTNQLGGRYSSSVTTSLERDSRDNVFFPSGGSDTYLGLELAGSILGGDVDFYRVTTSSSWYLRHIWETALAVRAKGGYADSYSDTDVLPVFERYFLGGSRTVRGYDEWEVGPKDIYGNPEGGKAMFFTNFEYRIPVQKDFFHIISFWDAGYCWRELKEINLQDMQSGVGAGIRINIPMMGLLGIDYGYGIAARNGLIHFNIGTNF
ncbi:MAG: outer membrane protein assembly factor BamA [bacterium]|nr:outer membrane protein assembly factor BamA [bacterium]